MAKKFDTNPLDPDFPEQVKAEPKKTTTLPNPNGAATATARFKDPVETEEQTRKFDDAEFAAFQSEFRKESGNAGDFAPKKIYAEQPAESKNVSVGTISLPENILTALPYVPFSIIGIVAGIIELVFVPKSEPKVRYHAAQGLAAQLGIWVVLAGLGFLSWGSDIIDGVSFIFWAVTTVMLLIFAYKAFQGKPIHIETVQDLTDWLEDKIAPQK